MRQRKAVVVDTNVPIVANGRAETDGDTGSPSLACRLAAVKRLTRVLNREQVLLDSDGEILAEYKRHLQPSGQPGVGDRFYQEMLRFNCERVRQVELPRRPDGSYEDFPAVGRLANFDLSDRKFAALAKKENAPVLNATDSDWIEHLAALRAERIEVEFVCGCNRADWLT